jgi:hypothetical protein
VLVAACHGVFAVGKKLFLKVFLCFSFAKPVVTCTVYNTYDWGLEAENSK